AADADGGVGLERGALLGVVAARGFDQADHAGLDQVVDFHAGRQARGQVMGDAAHQVRVPHDGVVGAGALHGPVFGGGQVHATAPCRIIRSMKNSMLPRAATGGSQRAARRAISAMARAEALAGYAVATACWRCTAMRSQSQCGTAPRKLSETSPRKRSHTRASLSYRARPSAGLRTMLATTCIRSTPRSRASTLIRA